MDADQELARADAESVSSDTTVASGTNGNVQVVVRVRPPSSRERDQGYVKCVGVDAGAHSVALNFRPQPRTFTFDYVADEAVVQEDIFTSVGKPITDACLQGYHCCLIAYGQTGAGKTFTMEGPDSDSSSGGSPGFLAKANLKRHEKRGLIPRILDYIFQRMAAEKMQNCKDVEFVVKCSYLQIYNEQVSDLLDPASFNLTIHEDAKAGMYVEGLQEVVVSTAEATYGVFRRGSENRHVGMTAMNLESSRSHSVFTVVVESQRRNDGGVMNRRTSRFYLVDLAGSERQKHSESAGIRLKEAGSINKSLSALGNVIKALVDISEGKIRHVPYRDSKLTFLLKDALGGNSKCTLIANISPAEKNIDETLSTLKFAQRAKLIHNTAIVNEDMFGNPAVMGEEIRRLRLEIAALRANVGTGMGGDQGHLPCQEIQTESARTSRLEHIISQSVKRSLEAERKNDMDMHVFDLKLQATQAMCERLEKTLQSQKMIIRLRENTIKRMESGRPSLQPDEIVQDFREEIEQLRKQIEHHPDVVRFKMELDLCRGQLDDYEEERKDEELLSQIGQLENLNQTLKIEFAEMVEEKAQMMMELDEVASSRDKAMGQLSTLEEQFVLLREATERYRIAAEEASHRQEKAEEKLHECTREQDEVWRRSNLAEAQATEYAQELTALRSQAEKMKVAFNEQTRLQEDIFLELQKATNELDNSRAKVSTLQTSLDEASAARAEMEAKLAQAEETNVKTSASLQEAVMASERLAASLEEREAAHVDVVRKLEQDVKSTDEKLAVVSLARAEAEASRDAAVQQKEDLLRAAAEKSVEHERAVEEERRMGSENMEKLRNEMDAEVKQVRSELESKLAQLANLEELSSHHASALENKDSLLKAAEVKAAEQSQQLEQVAAEVSAHKLHIQEKTSELDSSGARLASLLEDKAALESKVVELEQTCSSLDTAKTQLEDVEKRLSETKCLLQDAQSNLEAALTENETLRSGKEETIAQLVKERKEFEVIQREWQFLQTEVAQRSDELQLAHRDKSAADSSLAEERSKNAATEKHSREVMKTIDGLRAHVAALAEMKPNLLHSAHEGEEPLGERTHHSNEVVAETANHVGHSPVLPRTVESEGNGELRRSLETKADMEMASRALQDILERVKEEADALRRTITGLQKDNGVARAKEAETMEALHAKEDALRVSSSDLEMVKSKLQEKAGEMEQMETWLSEKSSEIKEAVKIHQDLKTDHATLKATAEALQDEKEELGRRISAMEDSTESLRREKAALEEQMGSRFEHGEKATEEEVKDVDFSNHVVHEETSVCIDKGANHIDPLATKKVDLGSGGSESETEEDKRPQEQGTDARLVAALADVPPPTGAQSPFAGRDTELPDLALKSHESSHAPQQQPLSQSRRDFETRVARPTGECTRPSWENRRNRAIEAELDHCRNEAGEPPLPESPMQHCSSTPPIDHSQRVAELESERETLAQELDEVKEAKVAVETQLLSTETELARVRFKLASLDGDLQLSRRKLCRAVEDGEGQSSRLKAQVELIDGLGHKLARAEGLLAEEAEERDRLQTQLDESELTKGDLEKQLEALQAEKVNLVRNLEGWESEMAGMGERIRDLTHQLEDRDAQVGEMGRRAAAELQELRDEVQYNLGEAEYEFQRHVIDSEARMADLEAQKSAVQTQASLLTGRISAENAKFANMLGALEAQLTDHHGRARSWVDSFHGLESELRRIEGFDARAKRLEQTLLLAGPKAEEDEAAVRLDQSRLAEQAKRATNPFSWSNSLTLASAKPEGLESSERVTTFTATTSKDHPVPKFTAQQRRRAAPSSKDRLGGAKPKSTTTHANQNVSPLKPLGDARRPWHTARSQMSRPNSAGSQAEKPKKKTTAMMMMMPAKHMAAQMMMTTRPPLRPISGNSNAATATATAADESSSRRPPVGHEARPRYDHRRKGAENAEEAAAGTAPAEPPLRSQKCRRLA